MKRGSASILRRARSSSTTPTSTSPSTSSRRSLPSSLRSPFHLTIGSKRNISRIFGVQFAASSKEGSLSTSSPSTSLSRPAASGTKNKRFSRYWDSAEQQKAFMIDLGKKLGFKEGTYDGWYNLTYLDLVKARGRGLIGQYRSLAGLLQAMFPEHKWDIAKFKKRPRNYWSFVENQRTFLDELGRKLGIKEGDFEGWYKVSNRDFMVNGGGRLLRAHNSSISTILTEVYPSHNWDPSLFVNRPRNFWSSTAHQRELMEKIRAKLNLPEGDYSAWYRLSKEELSKAGAATLLLYSSNSPYLLLKGIYPDHDWDASKFRGSRTNTTGSVSLEMKNLEASADQLK